MVQEATLAEQEGGGMRAWDLLHCPPWTEHVFVGAGAREAYADAGPWRPAPAPGGGGLPWA